MRCKHCNGTGEAPDKIVLECVSCQRKVTILYNDLSELSRAAKNVLCAVCKTLPE